MKTDFEKSTNKLNITIMVVTLILCLLMTGGFAVLINADKLGIGQNNQADNSGDFDSSFDEELDSKYVPSINFSYSDEQNVKYVLSDFLQDDLGYNKAVPVSEKAAYIEFEPGSYNSYEIDCFHASFDLISYTNGKSTISLDWDIVNNLDYYIDETNKISGNYQFNKRFKEPAINFVRRGSGIYLKLINSHSNEFIIVGDYSLQIVEAFVFSTEGQPFTVSASTDYGDFVYTIDNRYCFIQNSVYDFSTYDRSVFDPYNKYLDYDYAEFYAYGDSYWELINRLDVHELSASIEESILGAQFYRYARFRIY